MRTWGFEPRQPAPYNHSEVLIEHIYVPGSVLGSGGPDERVVARTRLLAEGVVRGGWVLNLEGKAIRICRQFGWFGWERDVLVRATGRWTCHVPRSKLGVRRWEMGARLDIPERWQIGRWQSESAVPWRGPGQARSGRSI